MPSPPAQTQSPPIENFLATVLQMGVSIWDAVRLHSMDGWALSEAEPGPVLGRFVRFLLIGLRAPSTYQSKLTLSTEAACV